MKKFFSRLFYALLPISLLNFLLFGSLLYLADREDLSYVNYASSLDKAQRLKSLAGHKRLVIIGGSNTRFCIQSGLLRDSLGIEPANMGIHVGLGLNYMFEEIYDELRKDDILLVSAEYTHYLSEENYRGGEGLTDMYLIHRQWNKALGHVFETRNFFSVYRLLARRIKRMNTEASDIPDRMETRNKYNSYGDYTGHYRLPRRPFRINPLQDEPASTVLADIRQKIKILKQRGVGVYLIPPPYCRSAFVQDSAVIRRINERLKSDGIPFIADPGHYTYADSLFYDTQYHLTREGGRIHTLRLLENLKPLLLPGYSARVTSNGSRKLFQEADIVLEK